MTSYEHIKTIMYITNIYMYVYNTVHEDSTQHLSLMNMDLPKFNSHFSKENCKMLIHHTLLVQPTTKPIISQKM